MRKYIEINKNVLQSNLMCPKHSIKESDKTLFRQAVQKAKPLSHTKTTASKRNIPQKKPETVNFPPLTETEALPTVKSEEYIQYAHPSLPYKILRKLKSGYYNVEAILDLHGKTVDEAEIALRQFLLECSKRHIGHALIIHGKGRNKEEPILKNKLNHWLRQCEEVLAFCTAGKHNTGALTLLLKTGGPSLV